MCRTYFVPAEIILSEGKVQMLYMTSAQSKEEAVKNIEKKYKNALVQIDKDLVRAERTY